MSVRAGGGPLLTKAGGVPVLLASDLPLSPSGVPPSVPAWSGLLMSDVSPGNLAAWWDAGSLSGLREASGLAPTIWGTAITQITDKTGNGHDVTFPAFTAGDQRALTGVISLPNLAGAGGVGAFVLGAPGGTDCTMDPTFSAIAASMDLRASIAWSLTVVFSRPSLAQLRNGSTGAYGPNPGVPTVVLAIGGVTVLSLASNSVTDTLKLFPGGANVSLATGVSRAFTCSVTLINTPGTGIAAYYNDALIGSAIANPITSVGPLALPSSASQIMFHEAPYWSATLAAADLTRLHGAGATAAAKRWARSNNRKSPTLTPIGQSNLVGLVTTTGNQYVRNSLNDAPRNMLLEAIRYNLGALWVNMGGDSLGGGVGGLATTGGADMLVGDTNQPSPPINTYPYGARGQAIGTYFSSMSADRQALISILQMWTEGLTAASSDPVYIKGAYETSLRRLVALLRASASASVPWMTCYAVPYAGTNGGQQSVSEMNTDLAADGSFNGHIVAPQLLDTLPSGASYDASTGAFGTNATGGVAGDNAHRDAADWPRIARRIAPSIAAFLATAGLGDVSNLPSGISTASGPRITAAHYEGIAQGVTYLGSPADTILVTIAHDPGYAGVAGVDLYTQGGALAYLDSGTPRPSAAAQGAGWLVQDGGTAYAPTIALLASACVRVSSTTLRVTLRGRLSSTSQGSLALAKLFYTWGCDQGNASIPLPSQLGRGNAIYDNYAFLTKPAGTNYAADYGNAENMPLATTPYGIAFT